MKPTHIAILFLLAIGVVAGHRHLLEDKVEKAYPTCFECTAKGKNCSCSVEAICQCIDFPEQIPAIEQPPLTDGELCNPVAAGCLETEKCCHNPFLSEDHPEVFFCIVASLPCPAPRLLAEPADDLVGHPPYIIPVSAEAPPAAPAAEPEDDLVGHPPYIIPVSAEAPPAAPAAEP